MFQSCVVGEHLSITLKHASQGSDPATAFAQNDPMGFVAENLLKVVINSTIDGLYSQEHTVKVCRGENQELKVRGREVDSQKELFGDGRNQKITCCMRW